jgi:RNA polymerase sigma factor (sigma-70 family)
MLTQRPTATDADLVARARAGDRDAFARLLARHGGVARSLAERWLARADVVDDVMQEAAVEALLRLDALRRPDRFGPWLCGIALNVVRRWWRQSSREVPVAELLEPPVEPPALDFETTAGVRDALARLPAGQRSALVLFYFADLPVGQIAERLGISPGAVKTRLHAGRAGLRRQPELEREEPTMPPDDDRFIELTVGDVRREPEGPDSPLRRHVMILRERDGARVLPIWIGPAEATQIALALQGKELPRPTAYVFMQRLLETAGVRLREARITRLDGVTFHAEAVVEGPHGSAAVDARPSDAINLALAAGRPVTAAASLLEDERSQTELAALEAAHPEDAGRITADAVERLRQSLAQFEAERRSRS